MEETLEETLAEGWTPLEKGKGHTTPLLNKDESITEYTEDGSLDIHGRPAFRHTTGGWRPSLIIFGVKCLEGLGYYGIATNLAVYLNKILNEDNASIAKSVTMWAGTCYFTPLLGAYIADSHWGRYRTILVFALIYFLGMVVITISAFLSLLNHDSREENFSALSIHAQKYVFFTGLYIIAFGSGSINSLLLPFGADQFEEGSKVEREKKGSFFNWYYFSLNLGALISSTLLVWLEENVDWALGFGISTMCVAVAIGMFLAGSSIYRLKRPDGSAIKRLFQVLVASVRKTSFKVPDNNNLLYEVQFGDSPYINGTQRILHTDGFRFLDKAAVVMHKDVEDNSSPSPWMLCTVTQVEELKILLRFIPIWTSGLIYSVAYAQMNSTFVEQGSTMKTKVGPFSIPPASLFAFEVVSVIICVIIYDKLVVPIGKKFIANGRGFSELQRMGIGRFLMILAMAAAALLEEKRLNDLNKHGRALSIAWQLPQYFILGASDVFNFVGQLEFFYSEAPDAMRSICSAFSLLSASLGNYLSSVFITIVTFVSTRGGSAGWIPADLNEGHLDYFFWALSALNALSFVAHLACAKSYKPKRVLYSLV